MEKALTEPELGLGHELFVNAFIHLDTERLYESGPIPRSAIVKYCREYGLDNRQREDMYILIRSMDNAVMATRAKEAERRAKNAT